MRIPSSRTSNPRTLFLLAWLLVSAGCRQGVGPGGSSDHEEHAGHTKPAHRPDTFAEAVQRLRGLSSEIGEAAARGRDPAVNLRIALDIANWLPEIAAESDMPEAPWNEVNSVSATLSSEFQKASSGSAGREQVVGRAINDRISALERLLSTANPKWFEDVVRRASSASSQAAISPASLTTGGPVEDQQPTR